MPSENPEHRETDSIDDNPLHQTSGQSPETAPIIAEYADSSSVNPALPSGPTDVPEAIPINPSDLETDSLSHLHPVSLLFDVISHGRSYLIPALIAMFSAARGDAMGIIIAGLIFFPALIVSVVRYFTFRYTIQNRQLIVTKGLLFRSARTVPVSRIQNVDYVQNLLHRILKVAEVRVETASGTEPEAILRVLSIDQMDRLRDEIFNLQTEEKQAAIAGGGESISESQAVDPTGSFIGATDPQLAISRRENENAGITLLEIPAGWLVKAGLASNRGLIMIGIAIGAMFQFGEGRRLDRFFEQIEPYIPKDADLMVIVGGVIAGLAIALVLLRLLGIGWFLLRFFSYRLVRHGEDLRISCGLFTKVSATVPRNRIQFISVHRNLIMRWMGLASIRIETAGGAGKQSEDATTTVSRRWFVPVIPEDQLSRLLSEVRPGLNWDEQQLDFQPLASKAGRRMSRLAILASLAVAAVGLGISQPWGWIAGVIALPISIWLAIKKSQSMKYARTNDGVVYRSGVLNRKTSMTFYEKIQALRVDQSPFDRRWKMATLSVDTAAAGPAEHKIDIPYMDEAFVMEEIERLRLKAARHQPSFG